MLKNHKINPLDEARSLKCLWSPQVIARVDDTYIKIVKLKGELVWHKHELQDEMFMVLEGSLRVAFQEGSVTLNAGDIYVVGHDNMHNPIAEHECLVMLIEHKSTEHTGNVINDQTKSHAQQLRGINI